MICEHKQSMAGFIRLISRIRILCVRQRKCIEFSFVFRAYSEIARYCFFGLLDNSIFRIFCNVKLHTVDLVLRFKLPSTQYTSTFGNH